MKYRTLEEAESSLRAEQARTAETALAAVRMNHPRARTLVMAALAAAHQRSVYTLGGYAQDWEDGWWADSSSYELEQAVLISTGKPLDSFVEQYGDHFPQDINFRRLQAALGLD